MLRPNIRLSEPPIPVVMASATVANAPGEIDDNRPMHTDYNLQPLLVHSLGHYVIRAEEGERFHIRWPRLSPHTAFAIPSRLLRSQHQSGDG